MHEAQVVPKVLSKLGETSEANAVPEPAATNAPEESLTHHARDGAIGRSIVSQLDVVRLYRAEALEASLFPPLRDREDA